MRLSMKKIKPLKPCRKRLNLKNPVQGQLREDVDIGTEDSARKEINVDFTTIKKTVNYFQELTNVQKKYVKKTQKTLQILLHQRRMFKKR